MKTKTDSFSKFITFCVLAFFLFTNMILFSSCDNGNSPNDNTNEEQNNNAPTDYCEICDGVQIENCGIEHKCNDENCVEYADKKIYKNGHTHDYCSDPNCTTDHGDAGHPVEHENSSWFKPVSIGGSDLYQVYCIDNIQYNKDNDFTTESKVNAYLEAYIDYINSLTLNENLTGNVENNLNNIKSYPITQKLNLLIGTTANDTGTIYSQINGINDICAPAINKIAQNINITKDKQLLDKSMYKLIYRAIDNYVYGSTYDFTNTNYTTEKTNIERVLDNINKGYSTSYSIYNQDGTICPEALQLFDEMNMAAATKLKTQFPQIENMETIVRNYVNLSFATSGLEGILDKLCPSLGIDPETCKNNEMVDVIEKVEISEMTPIAQAKLNKSVFSQDYGRELC